MEASAPGVAVHAVSAKQPETLDALARASRVAAEPRALLGSSGVGKSTIVNRLVGHDLMRTRRRSRSRTAAAGTRAPARQLVVLEGDGILIDTPGMRELQLWDGGESLGDAFADVAELAAQLPVSRLPACVGTRLRRPRGGERGELPAGRFESYAKLAAEREHQQRQLDERAMLEEKRRTKTLTKALNKHLKDKRR